MFTTLLLLASFTGDPCQDCMDRCERQAERCYANCRTSGGDFEECLELCGNLDNLCVLVCNASPDCDD